MSHSRAKREVMAKAKKNWIQGVITPEKKGSLHKTLGIPEGRKIPERKLEKATNSQNDLTRKRAKKGLGANNN